MSIDTFDGLTPTHAIKDDPAVLVGVDCPRGDSDRAYMVGTWLGRAHLTCTVGGHVWIEDAPTGTCDLNIGAGLHCGRPWGHDSFCAVSGDAGFTTANIPVVIAAVVLLALIPNVLITAVGMVGLGGWFAFGRSWVREGA